MFIELTAAAISRPEPRRVMDALREAFKGLGSRDTVQPSQTVIALPNGEGDCIVYSAYVGSVSAIGVKASPYLVARARRGASPVTAYTLVLSATDGTPVGLVDSLGLTVERTAATTLLGVQALIGDCVPGTVAIIGTGAIGRSHARYAAALFPDARVVMYSPSAVADDAVGEARRALIAGEASGATVGASLAETLAEAEVVMACTSSGTPVVDLDALAADVVITSVGTNAPSTHEIDWHRLPELDVYCDYRETCATTAGDFTLAQEAGTWSASAIVADLPELLTGVKAPAAGPRRRYFRSTGLGLEDVVAAALVVQSA